MIGEIIEHYRIVSLLGRGGMGSVYQAVDINLDRAVAVKVLNAELRSDPDFVERFRREARIQASLSHPNIATLFDFFISAHSPVAVMEFIEGETLQSTIRRRGPIPAHLSLPMFQQALQGVAAGHRRGIIHRDLKPANLMINQEGLVKITDFGIAKVQGAIGLTQASTRVGSSSYMAPEQILGRPVDARTDIYALGATLYELLSGQPPFQAKVQFAIETAHVREVPPPPTIHYPHIPQPAVDAVMRALAKDPRDRFATAEEFMQALPDLQGIPYIGPTLRAPDVSPAPVSTTATRIMLNPASNSGASVASAPIPDVSNAVAVISPPTADMSAAATRKVQLMVQAHRPPTKPVAMVAGIAATVLAGALVIWFAVQSHKPSNASINEVARVSTAGVTPDSLPPSPNATRPAATPAPTKFIVPSLSPSRSPREAQSPAIVAMQRAPAAPANKDLSGVWTGVYVDTEGRAQLHVLGMEITQITAGDITGSLRYQTETGDAEECSLEKSSYSPQTKLLKLLVHCRNPNHPKYLNVPLDFANVDPGTNSLSGGRLEFGLGKDISVNLKRNAGT